MRVLMLCHEPVDATRVRSVEAGRFLEPDELTPERVRAEARLLLDDLMYRQNARRLQAEIAAMPAPDRAVELLERLAAAPALEVGPTLVRPAPPSAVPVDADPRGPAR